MGRVPVKTYVWFTVMQTALDDAFTEFLHEAQVSVRRPKSDDMTLGPSFLDLIEWRRGVGLSVFEHR